METRKYCAVASMEKRTPPIGAPNVDETPTAQPTASICSRSGFERRIEPKHGMVRSNVMAMQHAMCTKGPTRE